ncbi:MAG: hypothetical protein J3Q66DRAFT_405006 [Benniella sp.]|nr:MAG: hypothetical protein J3Q66DRAFT_405006 [Benniella sp.]
MFSTHCLDLPETLLCVASYLPRRSLPVCALVSKAWYRVFHPLAWKEVEFNKLTPNQRGAIQLNGHFVRTFEIGFHSSMQGHIALRLPTLDSLVVNRPHPNILHWVTELPSLSRLDIKNIKLDPQSGFWDKLLEFHHLRQLEIDELEIPKEDVDTFWQICTRLE